MEMEDVGCSSNDGEAQVGEGETRKRKVFQKDVNLLPN